MVRFWTCIWHIHDPRLGRVTGYFLLAFLRLYKPMLRGSVIHGIKGALFLEGKEAGA
jgi:hypothetical protein